MLSLVEIENIIHKARIEQMKGNVSASLLLYNQAMNAIDAKMEEKLPQKESEKRDCRGRGGTLQGVRLIEIFQYCNSRSCVRSEKARCFTRANSR